MSSRLRIALLVVVAGCTQGGTPAEPDDMASEQSQLSGQSVERFLSGLEGSWYGEVAGVYRACITISPLGGNRPWQLQTITYRIVEGGELSTASLSVSRNAYAVTTERDYFLSVPEQAETPLLQPGTYQLMNAAKQRAELRFTKEVSGTMNGTLYSTATGVYLAKSKQNELTFARFDGDLYCFEGGVGSVCGMGGYRPFALKRSACPSF